MPQDLCAREGVTDEDVLRGQNSEHVSSVAFEVAKQAKACSGLPAHLCWPQGLYCTAFNEARNLQGSSAQHVQLLHTL